MLEKFVIGGGIAIIVLMALYFIIKWAVKNGINESVLGQSVLKKRNKKNDEE